MGIGPPMVWQRGAPRPHPCRGMDRPRSAQLVVTGHRTSPGTEEDAPSRPQQDGGSSRGGTPMQNTSGVPWAQVAGIAGGVVAVVLATRGLVAVGKVALRELDYRSGYGIETWVRSRR